MIYWQVSVAERRIEHMPLHAVRPATRNPKRHDRDGIRRSIAAHGFLELPVLDERTGRLVAGHGRIDQLAAMHTAGATPPDGVHVGPDGTWQVPVVRGWASSNDAHAEAYLVASNKLTTNGGWDDNELVELLKDAESAGLLDLTGYDEDELAALLHQDDLPMGGGAPDEDEGGPGWGVVIRVATAREEEELLQRMLSQGRNAQTLTAWAAQ
jgi:hypothetical protein